MKDNLILLFFSESKLKLIWAFAMSGIDCFEKTGEI